MMDQYRLQRFGEEDSKDIEYQNYLIKKHKPLAKLSENIVQNIKNIESEVKQKRGDKKEGPSVNLKDYLEDEDKKKILEKTKELYKKLPKSKEDIFAFQLNWNYLFKYEAVEKVGRPWIGKKVKEYMGVEEQSVV